MNEPGSVVADVGAERARRGGPIAAIAAIAGLAGTTPAVVASTVITGLHEPESVAFVGPMAGAAALILMVLGIIKTRSEANDVAVSLLRRLIDRASDSPLATVVLLAVCALFPTGATRVGCEAIGEQLVACDEAGLLEWRTWRGAARTPACEPKKMLTVTYWLPFNGGKPPAITCVFLGVAREFAQPAPSGGSLCGSAPDILTIEGKEATTPAQPLRVAQSLRASAPISAGLSCGTRRAVERAGVMP